MIQKKIFPYEKVYRAMVSARYFDEAIIRLYRQGKIVGGAYSQIGNEATSVGSAAALEIRDIIFPMHRDLGAHFVRGKSAKQLFINHLAREGSETRGTDGTGHYADPSINLYGNISHLGAMAPVACGTALASVMDKTDAVTLTYIGDGGAQVGDVHETLNFAAVQKLPLILIIENNQYAYSTPVKLQYAAKKLSDRAKGYGIEGITIDGTDVELVYNTVKKAIAHARAGKGPTLIESVTMRMRGHAEHDDFTSYVPKKMLTEWSRKDPITLFEKKLIAKKIFSQQQIMALRDEVKKEIDNAAEGALVLPPVDGAEALKGVFVE